MSISNDTPRKVPKAFRFEAMWLAYRDFDKVVNQISNASYSGNAAQKIRSCYKELKLNTDLRTFLDQEEVFYAQKARANWLQLGYKNTKYFHTQALIRRKRNQITRIRDPNGLWVEGDVLHHTFIQAFKLIFTADQTPNPLLMSNFLQLVEPCITSQDNVNLLAPVSYFELEYVVWGIGPLKAPGPGLQALTEELWPFKLDLEKAYDLLDWRFIRGCLAQFGFSNDWCDRIMNCVSSTSFSLLINGSPYGHFRASRGIRQGDPLSPYIFILCMEPFIRHLNCIARNPKSNMGLLSSPGGDRISNMVFADDCLIFARATTMAAKNINTVLEKRLLSRFPGRLSLMFGQFCLKVVDGLLVMVNPFPSGLLIGCTSINPTISNQNFDGIKWLDLLPYMKDKNGLNILSKALLLCWQIWEARNNCVFKNMAPHLASALTVAGQVGLDFFKNNSTPPLRPKGDLSIKWKPPPPDWMKLNFDGSVREHMAASGFVIRDWNGNVRLAGAKKLGQVLITVAECLALRDGLAHAINNGWSKIVTTRS
ncbi:hypothetical protein L3X38_033115 [Prunus dulcis]|uniref:Reverse transcriptase domain-containing protein n=1 Tax=Prunus dulcis TaxID=3755 RepID=A0AAD4VH09_PRUDU|nr:hypothetical protein L3X38_033115 [Prunus dulcis]